MGTRFNRDGVWDQACQTSSRNTLENIWPKTWDIEFSLEPVPVMDFDTHFQEEEGTPGALPQPVNSALAALKDVLNGGSGESDETGTPIEEVIEVDRRRRMLRLQLHEDAVAAEMNA